MRLQLLCELVLTYDDDGLTLVRPFGGEEAQGYGSGTGRATGEHLDGPLRWSNYPRMTDSGMLLPDARGVVATDAGPVLFELRGYSRLPAAGGSTRAVLASVLFRTEAEPYRWLNDVVAVHEGGIDFATMTARFPTYACIHEG